MEDPEEAAAWAAMRAAFADDEPIAPPEKPKVARTARVAAVMETADDADTFEAMCAIGDEEIHKPPVTVKGKGRGKGKTLKPTPPAEAPPSRKRPPTSQAVDDEDEVAPKAKRPLPESFQTQEEVDRLVGEVMRLVNGPLPDELLRAVWKLPLEGQHSILSDIVASEGGVSEPSKKRSEFILSVLTDQLKESGFGKARATKNVPAAAQARARPGLQPAGPRSAIGRAEAGGPRTAGVMRQPGTRPQAVGARPAARPGIRPVQPSVPPKGKGRGAAVRPASAQRVEARPRTRSPSI